MGSGVWQIFAGQASGLGLAGRRPKMLLKSPMHIYEVIHNFILRLREP